MGDSDFDVQDGQRQRIGGMLRDSEFNVPPEQLPYAKDLKTRLPYAESKLRTVIHQSIGAASACWTNRAGAGVFDSEQAVLVSDALVEAVLELTELGEPALGCATTEQLLDEIRARFELGNDGLQYRTIDEED